jgi:hypothetical protein
MREDVTLALESTCDREFRNVDGHSGVYSLECDNFRSWAYMLVGEPVAMLRSLAKPCPGYASTDSAGLAFDLEARGR